MSKYSFTGRIPESDGDYGGVCTLVLEKDQFVLEYVVYSMYSIEDGSIYYGTYTIAGKEVRMEAVKQVTYHEETVRQETTRSGKWQVTLSAATTGGPAPLSGAAGPFELLLNIPPRKKGGVGRKQYTELMRER